MKKCLNAFIILTVLIVAETSIAAEIGDVDIHGFVSQGYLKTNNNNYLADTEDGSFQFNEIGINFQTRTSEKLKMGIQLLAYDLGSIGNDEVSIDWAYADYRYNNMFGIRAGSLKMSIGLFNESRDIDALRTPIFLAPALYAEDWKEVFVGLKGIGLYGRLPGRITYTLNHGIIDVPADSGLMTFLINIVDVYIQSLVDVLPINQSEENAFIDAVTFEITKLKLKWILNGGIEWQSPVNGLKFKVTSVYIPVDIDMSVEVIGLTDTKSLKGFFNPSWLSMIYYIGETVFSVEYSHIYAEATSEAGNHDLNNLSINISHRFTDWLELGTYYSEFFYDKNDKSGSFYAPYNHLAWEKNYCFSARFDINDYWLLKLETHYIDGTLLVLPEDKLNPDELDDTFWLYAVKLSYSF